MIVRNILLLVCLAVFFVGFAAGCTPPAGGGSGSDVGGTTSRTEEGSPDPGALSSDLDEGAPPSDPLQALPSTTTPALEIPDLGDEAPPSTTEPATDIPALEGGTPADTAPPEPETPPSDS